MGAANGCCTPSSKEPPQGISSSPVSLETPAPKTSARGDKDDPSAPIRNASVAVADRRKSMLPQAQVARQMMSSLAANSSGKASASSGAPKKAVGLNKRGSQLNFNQRDQTIVIFDWDDTLFPTTWVRDDMALPWNLPCPNKKELIDPLKLCADQALEVIRSAALLSERVVVVTLAQSPWVEKSIECFFPSLEGPMKELNIPIVYARELVKDDAGDYDKNQFQSNEELMAYWTDVKAQAIGNECQTFYSRYEGQTWKNVLSIGDSDFEKEGTKSVTKAWTLANKRTATQLPRTKTVKMLDDPTIEELTDQLKLIHSWLPSLVEKDTGFNLDLELAGAEHFDNIEKLLKDAQTCGAEGPDTAILEGNLWKLNSDGDPMKESDWLVRRMWLSKTGRLWYESLKEVQPSAYFAGMSVGQLKITKSQPGVDTTRTKDGQPLFAMLFETPASTKPRMLAADSEASREQWMTCFKDFEGQGSGPGLSWEIAQRGSRAADQAKELRASHILVKHSGSRNPVSRRTNLSVSISIEQADMELRTFAKKVNKDNFGQMAYERSDCGSFKEHGDLSWFGAGEMQAPFEEATRLLKVGEVSGIVSTESGLHLILRTG